MPSPRGSQSHPARQQGIATLDEALGTVALHNDHWYDTELHRIKGDLLAKIGTGPDIVEACLQRALTIARSQQAKSLELRAAMSLGRLWHSQGRHAHARQLLAGIHAWFTEGFDTADLREAQALLDAWS